MRFEVPFDSKVHTHTHTHTHQIRSKGHFTITFSHAVLKIPQFMIISFTFPI